MNMNKTSHVDKPVRSSLNFGGSTFRESGGISDQVVLENSGTYIGPYVTQVAEGSVLFVVVVVVVVQFGKFTKMFKLYTSLFKEISRQWNLIDVFPALTYIYIYTCCFVNVFFDQELIRWPTLGGPMACSLGTTTMYCTIHAVESLREEEAETTWTAAGRQVDFISWEFLGLIYLYFRRGMLWGGRSCVSFLLI